jgi:GT2 family glycosyltransferase
LAPAAREAVLGDGIVRPAVFRVARRGWNWLPVWLRDFLRPILFPPGGIRARLWRAVPGSGRLRRAAPQGVRELRAGYAPRRQPFPRVQASVSVILPTLNAGPLFKRVLGSVAVQSGTGGLDVVVVDSGSTDGTPELAAAFGARVLRIPPEEFGHGKTRNLAADAATGDVLLMLVQDAVLLGAHTVRGLVAELYERPGTVAVSARQIPSSDSDLFGAFVACAHNAVMTEALAVQRKGRKPTPVQRRAAGSVDNVCAVIDRSAWAKLRFGELNFAEDLDFGLRAVERGWSVRLSACASVAHSHTRDAEYHLRRSVADRLYVAPLIGDDVRIRAAGFGCAAIAAAARVLAEEIQGALSAGPGVAPLPDLLAALRLALGESPLRLPPGDELLFLSTMESFGADTTAQATARVAALLREDLRALLEWPPLVRFARAQHAVDAATFTAFVSRLAASVVGRALGDALRDEQREGTSSYAIAAV